MKRVLFITVAAFTTAMFSACSERTPRSPGTVGITETDVTRGDIDSLKFGLDVLQYLEQQTKPTGVNIADLQWDQAKQELLVTAYGPGEETKIVSYDNLGRVMEYFFRKRFSKTDRLRVRFHDTSKELISEFVNGEKLNGPNKVPGHIP